MWEVVEAKTRKVRMAEEKGRRGKRRSRKKIGRAGEEEAKREENGRDKKSSKEMGNLG